MPYSTEVAQRLVHGTSLAKSSDKNRLINHILTIKLDDDFSCEYDEKILYFTLFYRCHDFYKWQKRVCHEKGTSNMHALFSGNSQLLNNFFLTGLYIGLWRVSLKNFWGLECTNYGNQTKELNLWWVLRSPLSKSNTLICAVSAAALRIDTGQELIVEYTQRYYGLRLKTKTSCNVSTGARKISSYLASFRCVIYPLWGAQPLTKDRELLHKSFHQPTIKPTVAYFQMLLKQLDSQTRFRCSHVFEILTKQYPGGALAKLHQTFPKSVSRFAWSFEPAH